MPRKEDRYTYLREVELEFASGRRTARISDISRGGCYIDTIAQVPVGEPVSLYITDSNGTSVQFEGRIAYLLEGFGFGVEFTEMTEERTEFLNLLLNSTTA